ncbi:ABC transporter ATP-binding protein [Oceanicola sp. S124]|uniref:ABC transporter ATP-binding protein n=1 Tax=Oceanicola sp. S124 TaxID=1042378 RepID=UPI0002558127|nr:ABC transporter ATP-binding protein [Oceanicola sp. S124]
MAEQELIFVQDLDVHFDIGREGFGKSSARKVRAVDGLTLKIRPGETMGLVGESGCGKSTAGRAILRLVDPTRGRVMFDGQDLSALGPRGLRQMRKRMQIVHQDPYASLNPRMKVKDIVGESLIVHGLAKGRAVAPRVAALLETVGLGTEAMERYPHEFSGGQRQRVGIARALAVEPDFIVLDESISALDVSIQAQIINLLKDLQRDTGVTYLFISHDMAVVRHMSDRVAVMYLGAVVEMGPSESLYASPRHPYTRALLKSVPVPQVTAAGKPTLEGIKGELASPMEVHKGCRFCNRCPLVQDICRQSPPTLDVVTPGHFAACHFSDRLATAA